jgi:hypothetical protein
MKLFKSKEEKLIDLEKEFNKLNDEYKDIIGKYCMIGTYVFKFKGFKIDRDKIAIQFVDKDTPNGYTNYMNFDAWLMRYDFVDLKKIRYAFIHFNEELKRMGLLIVENDE